MTAKQGLWTAFALLLVLSMAFAGYGTAAAPLESWTAPNVDETLSLLAALPFDQFVEKAYQAHLLRHPQRLTTHESIRIDLGIRNNGLDNYSPEYVHQTQQLESGILAILQTYPTSHLSPTQQITHAVCTWFWNDLVNAHPFENCGYPISHVLYSSLHLQLEYLLTEEHPWRHTTDAEDYVSRLGQVDDQLDQIVASLQRHSEEGSIVPTRIIDYTLSSIHSMMRGSAAEHPFYQELVNGLALVEGDTPGNAAHLLSTAEEVIQAEIVPAYTRLYEEMKRLRKISPEGLGVSRNPKGTEYYDYLIRHYTGLDLTADQAHELGMEAVDRLEAEIRTAITALGADATLPIGELIGLVSQEAGIIPSGSLAEEVSRLITEANQNAMPAFSSWPQADVDVVVSSYGPHYARGSIDGSSPPIFYMPARNAQAYTLPRLVHHETVPGHHLMHAMILERSLPLIQTLETFPGHSEGWAVYAERLADELGCYDMNPSGHIGRLRNEMLCAALLVIDTGIHSQGWTSWEATTYLSQTVGISRQEAYGAILRYAAWPAQSTAYLLGMQSILDLRESTRADLGNQFDLAAFHEAILSYGHVPLAVLEKVILPQLRAREESSE